jgi:peptidoglycan/xylan/chitin deacetylase (PgdA/CDA1 family)
MKPTVVISLDLELAWGSFDVAYGGELLARARWTHDTGVPILLDIFSRHGLSATWAMVGLAMQDRLPRIGPHEEVVSATHHKPWFAYVPRDADESTAPEWFGRTLLDRIRATSPPQEVGFHSLSHVVFGDPGTGPRRARQEFDGCRAIARRLGFPGTSFVFPRNSVHFLDELRAAGFRCYRSEDVQPVNLHPRGSLIGCGGG